MTEPPYHPRKRIKGGVEGESWTSEITLPMSTHEAEMGAITEASTHESESESGNSLAEKEGAGCEPRSAISITRNRHVHAKKSQDCNAKPTQHTDKEEQTIACMQRAWGPRITKEHLVIMRLVIFSPTGSIARVEGALNLQLVSSTARQLNSSSAQADPFLSLAQVHEFDIIRYNALNNQSLRMRPHALHYKVKVSYAKPFSVTNEWLSVFRGPSPHVLQNRRYKSSRFVVWTVCRG
ncbi:hypothetical protein A9K55_003756 [Cordyceps militaris]|uniref:Uncharacterized protein n=1 Tax=Cordyceps militaris TaxID=73501 RepID=A0A2H4S8E9_CORMI|nr:hypothetical protein A9K55_003756 [Cordyceps militaris]